MYIARRSRTEHVVHLTCSLYSYLLVFVTTVYYTGVSTCDSACMVGDGSYIHFPFHFSADLTDSDGGQTRIRAEACWTHP